MAASSAVSGFGTVFAYESTTDTYTALGEILSVSPPSQARDNIETTHMASDDGYREYIGGLRDGGESTVTMNYTEAGATLLQTLFHADVEKFKITLPGSSTSVFSAIVTGVAFDDVVVDDKIAMSMTLKVTGKPVFTAV